MSAPIEFRDENTGTPPPIPENPQTPNTVPRSSISRENEHPSTGEFMATCLTSINSSKYETSQSEHKAPSNVLQSSPQKRKKPSGDRSFPENRNPQNPSIAPRSLFPSSEQVSVRESASNGSSSSNYSMSELNESANAVASHACQSPPRKRQRTSDDRCLSENIDLPEYARNRMSRILQGEERQLNQEQLDKMEVDSLSESEDAKTPS